MDCLFSLDIFNLTIMKIFCIGRNYVDHAKELNNPVPKKPLLFMKPPSALLKEGKPFYYPDFTKELHYECEVVLKMKKNGRHVHPQYAESYIGEIGLGIDFTARDIQSECKKKGHPWEIAKAFDWSAPLGELVPYEEFVGKPIAFNLDKNGETVQVGNTADMIFNFATLISYISQYFIVQKGDYIYTGTPAGVGPVTIGDHFQGYLEGKKLLDFKVK